MKRAVIIIVGACFISAGLMLALRAQEQQAGAKSATTTVAANAASAEQISRPGAAAATGAKDGKVAFTFADDNQLQQFAQLWRTRQAILTRMATLQAYWKQEQAALDTANSQFQSQYNIDVNKNYRFDPEKKVLVEQETPAEQPPSLTGQPSTPSKSTP